MDKKELIIFGLVIVIAVLVLAQSVRQPAPVVVEEPVPVMLPAQELPEPVEPEPVVNKTPPPAQPLPVEPEPSGPARGELVPAYVEFYVNRIYIPPYFPTFIPVMDDDIKTFSGRFGPYYEDVRDYVSVELCAHARDYPDMFACEKVWQLNFIDNYVTFVRGYPPDEFIGNVALKNYGAYYVVKSREHGVIAESSVAPLRTVRD